MILRAREMLYNVFLRDRQGCVFMNQTVGFTFLTKYTDLQTLLLGCMSVG